MKKILLIPVMLFLVKMTFATPLDMDLLIESSRILTGELKDRATSLTGEIDASMGVDQLQGSIRQLVGEALVMANDLDFRKENFRGYTARQDQNEAIDIFNKIGLITQMRLLVEEIYECAKRGVKKGVDVKDFLDEKQLETESLQQDGTINIEDLNLVDTIEMEMSDMTHRGDDGNFFNAFDDVSNCDNNSIQDLQSVIVIINLMKGIFDRIPNSPVA